jgi:Subtilase family
MIIQILSSILLLASFNGEVSVDPKIKIYLNSPRFRGVIFNPSDPPARAVTDGDFVKVTVMVNSFDDLGRLFTMEDKHLKVMRRNRKPVIYGTVVSVEIDLIGLKRVETSDFIKRVELDLPARRLKPTDVTTSLIQSPQMWGMVDAQGKFLTGKGVVVADLDSGIDLFQPGFFYADGGYYDWIDTDNDGQFEHGEDGVDLNRNGVLDDGEILEYLDVRLFNAYGEITSLGGELTGGGSFQANIDYLYADTNGNHRRDSDFEATLSLDSSSLGEPFLIVDDVNDNGQLDPGEKLILLGTSKVKSYSYNGSIYRRGSNLRNAPINRDISHGTGVMGITAGGVIGRGSRWGIAPDVDIVAVNVYGTEGYFESLQWALNEGSNVVIHEFANNFGQFLDGSSNVEATMDQSSSAGVVHVAAAGNHGGSSKGYKSTIAPGENRVVHLNLPGGSSAPGYAQITLLWRNVDLVPDFSLEDPTGIMFDMNVSSTQVVEAGPNLFYFVTRSTSTRGTNMIDIMIFGDDGANYIPLNGGDYTLTIQHPDTNADAIELAGFSTDMDSGWAEGFKWLTDVSEQHLVGWPGTADSCVTVAAYVGRDEPGIDYYGQTQGELRDYSGRGIRIDGYSIMDIAAPANPLSYACSECTSADNKFGNMDVFGGTSGATPHAGGAAALLKQLFPLATGQEIKQKIRDGALVDSDVLTPGNRPQEEMWGAGKLRIYEAAYGTEAPEVSPPSIQPKSYIITVDEPLEITPLVSDGETDVSSLRVRYDVDYDGEWDSDFSTDISTTFTKSEQGVYILKAQVIDEDGFTASALLTVEVKGSNTVPDAGTDGDVDSGTVDSNDGGCSCSLSTPDKKFPFTLHLLMLIAFLMVLRRKIKK